MHTTCTHACMHTHTHSMLLLWIIRQLTDDDGNLLLVGVSEDDSGHYQCSSDVSVSYHLDVEGYYNSGQSGMYCLILAHTFIYLCIVIKWMVPGISSDWKTALQIFELVTISQKIKLLWNWHINFLFATCSATCKKYVTNHWNALLMADIASAWGVG